ncbi:UbiA family prenyltransferase, partial [Methylobacterium tarhaniae]|uniref:UbiA family prenyltransferase n=1 Tax=Methylobacterium tarhaniae TaxID=1187852 RepID=UPI003D064546
WLKRSTAQNIVIGGAAGALPPMIGQAVVTGSIGIEGTVLFLIIFIWTPPHFWALALVKAGEYARAGIPMMPNTAGPDSTRRQILAYSVLLAPLGLAPVFLGFGGLIYGLVGLIGGLAMVALSVQVLRRREGEAANKAAMSLFGFSILYLFLLFSALLAEQGLGLFRPVLG